MTGKKILYLLCLVSGFIINSEGLYSRNGNMTLRQALEDDFLIGTALNSRQISGADAEAEKIIGSQFNAIVAEGCMKIKAIHPEENRYDFRMADKFVEFGERHGQTITGHTLVWHLALPKWFYTDSEGKDVAPDVLKKRMREHIHTVVSRYKGRIKGWDVVNEAFNDDGTYRDTPFYRILGEEYIPLAFQYAHEADPEAELYYNDYNLYLSAKREAIIRLVRDLRSRGLRVDAVGMQCHLWRGNPTVEAVEKAIEGLAAENLKVMVTELDLTALPAPKQDIGGNAEADFTYDEEFNPYREGLTAEAEKKWTEQMLSFFRLFLEHRDVITRVTLWGFSDGDSWRNGWPVKGRTDYPLLFDRNYEPKSVVKMIVREARKSR